MRQKRASVSTEITVSPSLLSSYLFWKRHPCLNHWVRLPPLQQNSSFLLDLTVHDNGKYIQIQRSIISIFLCFDGTALDQSDKAQLCIAFYCLQMRLSSSVALFASYESVLLNRFTNWTDRFFRELVWSGRSGSQKHWIVVLVLSDSNWFKSRWTWSSLLGLINGAQSKWIELRNSRICAGSSLCVVWQHHTKGKEIAKHCNY